MKMKKKYKVKVEEDEKGKFFILPKELMDEYEEGQEVTLLFDKDETK